MSDETDQEECGHETKEWLFIPKTDEEFEKLIIDGNSGCMICGKVLEKSDFPNYTFSN